MFSKILLLSLLISTASLAQLIVKNNTKYNYTNLYVTPVDSSFKFTAYEGLIDGKNLLSRKLMANKQVVVPRLNPSLTYKIVLVDTSINGCYQNAAIVHAFKGSFSTLTISNLNVDLDFNTDCMEGVSEGRELSVYITNKTNKNIIKIYYSFDSDSTLIPYTNLYPWQPIQKKKAKSLEFRRLNPDETTHLYLKYYTEWNGLVESKTATLTFEKSAYMASMVLE